jgi:hypothetical protein
LRLNGYRKESNDLGFAIRTLTEVDLQLGNIGVALGLFPEEYRRVKAVGFGAEKQ